MGATTILPSAVPTVEPGGQNGVDVLVRNNGTVVDSFSLELIGPTAGWTVAEPPSVHLLPGEEATVQLTFSPPRDFSTRAGETPWAVQIRSSEDPSSDHVEEGRIEVAGFDELAAELAPRTSRARGRRRGKHQVAIDNSGNRSARVRLAAVDEAEKLAFEFGSTEVELEPGAAEVVALKVRATQRLWRGKPLTHPFTVLVEGAEGEGITAQGSLLQEPVIPKWMLKALLIAAAVAALLVVLWLTVLKPTVKDVARAEATDAASNVASKEAAAAAKDAANKAVAPVKKSVDALAAGAGAQPSAPAPTPTPTQPAANPDELSGTPVSTRLAAATGSQSPTVVLSKDATVRVTDLLLQNPQGDSGIVTLRNDKTVVYVSRLDNFRDLDLHLVAPIILQPGTSFSLEVSCENSKLTDPGAAARPCTPAVTLNGFARPAKP